MSAKAAKKKKASPQADDIEEKEVAQKELPKAKKAKKAKASEVSEKEATVEKTEDAQTDLAKKKKKKKKSAEETVEKTEDAPTTELAKKKKKKKKKEESTADEEEATDSKQEETIEKEGDTDFDFSKKKKKKKKKKEEEEEEEEEEEGDVPDTPSKASTPLKSALSQKSLSSITKKKVKIAAGFAPEEEKKEEGPAGEEEKDEEEEVAKDEELDFSVKKKKKKKKKGPVEVVEEPEDFKENVEEDENDDVTFANAPTSSSTVKGTWVDSDRDYQYSELLSTIYGLLNVNNPELMKLKNKFVIRPPDVLREGTKKTVWANFQEICDQMHRHSDHVLSYARAELGTSASVDGNFRLTIKGRFQPKQIESVVRHYINEYVTCRTCRSPDTLLKKENRLNFIQCKACGSTRSVAPIKQGFVAQVDKRKKV